jgi:uncharacterized membrane-anchored protein
MNQQPIEPLQPDLQPLPETEALPKQTKRLPGWRLWVPLLFQAMLIVAVPARDAYTYIAGTPVTLQTAPVDPYDLLRGYYQTLSYDISNPDLLRSLPGGDYLTQASGQYTKFYVVLAAPTPEITTPPTPWKPVRVSADRPTDLADHQVALQGHFNGWQVLYGLETYYMPEDRREQINTDISQVQGQAQRAFVVDIKVDASGNAVPISLWVRDRNYRF